MLSKELEITSMIARTYLDLDDNAEKTIHFVSNTYVRFTDEKTAIVSYHILHPELGARPGQPGISFYTDRVENRENGWVVIERQADDLNELQEGGYHVGDR